MCVHQSHQQLLVVLMLLIWAMARNGITWDNYVSLAVNNTSVNVVRTNSVKVEARKENMLMGFPSYG